MLKGILFHLVPAVAESLSAKKLLSELEMAGIRFMICTSRTYTVTNTTPFSAEVSFLSLTSADCLVLTDSATGISATRAAGIPCIGYAPPGGSEDLSGAYSLFEDFASIDVAYLRRIHAHAMGYPAHILSTERLIVREFSKADFPALYAMCTEPSTASFMEEVLSDYDTEKEKHQAYLRNVYPFFDLALWGICEKATGRLIGRAGFSLPEHASDTFSLGYLIDVPYRRCGFAKELLPALLSYAKEQGYTAVSATVKKDNIASQRTLSQCGFPYDYKVVPEQDYISYTIFLTM